MFTKELKLGSTGRDVIDLKNLLEKLDYGNFVPNDYFGPDTETAVIAFQKDHGIDPIGIVGPRTRNALNSEASPRKNIYTVALSFLGKDASPNDWAPDEYGCAETVSDILRFAGVKMPVIISTYLIYHFFLDHQDLFVKIDQPSQGDILVYPTGTGNGNLANGHIFICGEGSEDDMKLMSNDSSTGLFKQNYTIKSARARYTGIGGYKPHFFRVI